MGELTMNNNFEKVEMFGAKGDMKQLSFDYFQVKIERRLFGILVENVSPGLTYKEQAFLIALEEHNESKYMIVEKNLILV